MKRTRNKDNGTTIDNLGPATQQEYHNGVFAGTNDIPSGGPFVKVSAGESMVDFVSTTRKTKSCVHEKSYVNRGTFNSEVYYSGTNRYDTVGPNAHWLTWSPYGDLGRQHIDVRYPSSDDKLLRETYTAFLNSNDVNNVLNIVESPELITGAKHMVSLTKDVVELDKRTYWTRHLNAREWKRYYAKYAKNRLTFYSGGYLYYSFGIAPLISDMRKMSRALNTLKSDMERYARDAGKPKVVHRKITGSISDSIVPDSFGNWPYGYKRNSTFVGGWWTAELRPIVKPIKTCTIRGIRDVKYDSELFQKLAYLIDRFGANGPATVAWERIKFSFIIDWFVDTSVVLAQLDNLLTGANKVVQDASFSEKYELDIGIFKAPYSPSLISQLDGSETAQRSISYYRRDPAPTPKLVAGSGRFGKRQGSLTAALFAQWAANLKRQKAKYNT